MDNAKDIKKEQAKLKRMAQEVAQEIHDLVEDRLWQDYDKMPGLAQNLVDACQKAADHKKEHLS